jgi:hypothetical protein
MKKTIFLISAFQICFLFYANAQQQIINVSSDERNQTPKSTSINLQQSQSLVDQTQNEGIGEDGQTEIFSLFDTERELVEKRDRTSKHFSNPDGTITAMLSTGSLNYYEDGKWHTIQRNYLPNQTGKHPDYHYANTANSFHTFFSNQQHKGIITYINETQVHEWKDKKFEFLDAQYQSLQTMQAVDGNVHVANDKAIFYNIFPHTDAHITQLYDGRKIDYELTSTAFLQTIPAGTQFVSVSESIVLPQGWTVDYYIDTMQDKPQKDKQQLSVFNAAGEEILRYMPPAYFEKNNQMEGDVGEYLFEVNGNILTIKTVVPVAWITDPLRVFPLVIDPTVSVTPNNTNRWTVTARSNGAELANLYCGVATSWLQGHMRFNTSSIPFGSIVNSATGWINIFNWSGLSSTRTWTWRNSIDPVVNTGSTLYNSATADISASGTIGGSGWRSRAFDATGLTHIQNGLGSNVFVTMRASGSWNNNDWVEMRNHTHNDRPYLSVNYTAAGGPPQCVSSPLWPTNGSVLVSALDALRWASVPGADSYDIYFGTSSNPPFLTNVTGTSHLPAMGYNTQYYFRIVPKNNDGDAVGCATWSFTTRPEPPSELIFEEDFESYTSLGAVPTSGTNTWIANTHNFQSGNFRHLWAVQNIGTGNGAPINSKSLGMGFYDNAAYFYANEPFKTYNGTTCGVIPTTSRWAYRLVSLQGYQNIQVEFKWRAEGELDGGTFYDYGTVNTSINGGSNWILHEEGWLAGSGTQSGTAWLDPATTNYSGGIFASNPGVRTAIINLPSSRDNQADFALAFRMVVDACYGSGGGFIIDDIRIYGDPIAGAVCAQLSTPTNSFLGHDPNDPLTWQASSGADSYDVYFGTTTPPPFLANTHATSYLPQMDYNTQYYWQIIPKSAGGDASGCDIWSFTTASAPVTLHNQGGSQQLTFNNSTVQTTEPVFRISHTQPMQALQLQISTDVTFATNIVFDNTFTGNFTGQNNFVADLISAAPINPSIFPQGFDSNVLTHGSSASTTAWFAPSSNSPIAWTASGGNPGGRVGYSSAWNNFWGNFLRLPEVDATGMDEITLSFDVWHSYFTAHPNDRIRLYMWADGGYRHNVSSVEIDGVDVTADFGANGKGFSFAEVRDAAQVVVTFDISAVSNKSDILLYIEPSCGYNNSNAFYVYFDNVSVNTAPQQLVDGTTYYARARANVGGSLTAWTPDTFSFTYRPTEDIQWYQTMAPQFMTGELDNITIGFTPDKITLTDPAAGGGGNPFTDPSFETGAGWSTSASYAVYETYRTTNDNGTNGRTHGSYVLKYAEDDNSWQSFVNGEYNNASQQVDLTGVTNIVFDITHWRNTQSNIYQCGVGRACKVVWSFKVIIGDAGTSNNNSGTEVYNWTPTTAEFGVTNNNNVNVDISSFGFTGTKTVKFARVVTNGGGVWYCDDKYYLDNIRTEYNAPVVGTIVSTPITLSSFHNAANWKYLFWEQIRNNGTVELTVQKFEGGTWQDISNLTNITNTADGLHFVDISAHAMNASMIRLKATLTKNGIPDMFNWGVTAEELSPLPVNLLSFQAECNNQDIVLKWQTASEINNDYFEIEMSTNGENFVPIARVAGQGNSNSIVEYVYEYETQTQQTHYFRLKQVDFDGTIEYFNPISVRCSQAQTEIDIFPNPFDGKGFFIYSGLSIDNVVIIIHNSMGQLAFTKDISGFEGKYYLSMDKVLPSGTYFVTCIVGKEVVKKKLVVQ